jgi:hypothetical protein
MAAKCRGLPKVGGELSLAFPGGTKGRDFAGQTWNPNGDGPSDTLLSPKKRSRVHVRRASATKSTEP